jgi:hypothetical protein
MTAESPIELDFKKSWDDIEEFYIDLFTHKGWDYVKPIQNVIKLLRTLGYDKLLRAGQSIYMLVLSRSRHWGLRNEQHRVGIEATPKNIFRIWYVDGTTTMRRFEAENLIDNKDLQETLNQLLQQHID